MAYDFFITLKQYSITDHLLQLAGDFNFANNLKTCYEYVKYTYILIRGGISNTPQHLKKAKKVSPGKSSAQYSGCQHGNLYFYNFFEIVCFAPTPL